LGSAAGPRNFLKNSGSAGGLAAGDLPGFSELRGDLSALSGFRVPAKMTGHENRWSVLLPAKKVGI
jgi:hypothetical protein